MKWTAITMSLDPSMVNEWEWKSDELEAARLSMEPDEKIPQDGVPACSDKNERKMRC